MDDTEWLDLAGESQELWEQNAAFWDEHMKEANDFQRLLVNPTTERLLDLKENELILEIACGNGSFARRLTALGARVVAFDFSPTFIELARARTTENTQQIEYAMIDATDREQMLCLGEGRFDAAVCNMAVMDMAAIDPVLEAVRRLLKPGGRFVFSVMHPCFNSVGNGKIIEEEDREGILVTRHKVSVQAYITPQAARGLGVIGQPVPHYYFHRPLSALLKRCFQAGFVIDGLEEPVFPAGSQGRRPTSWENFKEIPPVLVVRLRNLIGF
jgi:2-polyprenyl-3-methyl-5-hydroxy-6-metoxy-1,4-benzoquinol methylase